MEAVLVCWQVGKEQCFQDFYQPPVYCNPPGYLALDFCPTPIYHHPLLFRTPEYVLGTVHYLRRGFVPKGNWLDKRIFLIDLGSVNILYYNLKVG